MCVCVYIYIYLTSQGGLGTTLSYTWSRPWIKRQDYRKRDANNEIIPRLVIEKEIEVLDEKPLCNPLSRNDPLVSKVGVQGYQKDPPSLIYLIYLNPPSSSSQRTSPSLVFTSFPDPALSSKLHLPINGFFQYFSDTPKLLLTLRLGEVNV